MKFGTFNHVQNHASQLVPRLTTAAGSLQQGRHLLGARLQGAHSCRRSTRAPHRQLVCRADGDTSSDLLLGGKIDVGDLFFSKATVIENREASADGTVRTLVLSVEDHVSFLDGRKIKHIQENPRYVDAYRAPGQFVAVRYSRGGGSLEDSSSLTVAKHLQAIASSPYEARRDSALLDACIIELLVDRNGDEDEQVLAELGPGGLIEVSNVVGQGYASLFNTRMGLSSVLEDSKAVIMIGIGCRGIAPLHAVLTWTPIQAHATAHPVSLFYVAESQASAAYLVEWDAWREAGVHVRPLYVAPGDHTSAEKVLESAIFHGENGLRSVTVLDPRDAMVLMSGVPGDTAAHLTRKFTNYGVASERILFCDYM